MTALCPQTLDHVQREIERHRAEWIARAETNTHPLLAIRSFARADGLACAGEIVERMRVSRQTRGFEA